MIPPRHSNALETDLPCAKCGYNLRSLNHYALCPECGASLSSPVSQNLRFPVGMRSPVAECLSAVAASWLINVAFTVFLLGIVFFDPQFFVIVALILLMVEHTHRFLAIRRLTRYLFLETLCRDDPRRLYRFAILECATFASLVAMFLLLFCHMDLAAGYFSFAAFLLSAYSVFRGLVTLYVGRLVDDLQVAMEHRSNLGRLNGQFIGAVTFGFTLLVAVGALVSLLSLDSPRDLSLQLPLSVLKAIAGAETNVVAIGFGSILFTLWPSVMLVGFVKRLRRSASIQGDA